MFSLRLQYYLFPTYFPLPKCSHVTPSSILNFYNFFTKGCTMLVCICTLICIPNTMSSVYEMLPIYTRLVFRTNHLALDNQSALVLLRRLFLPLPPFISCWSYLWRVEVLWNSTGDFSIFAVVLQLMVTQSLWWHFVEVGWEWQYQEQKRGLCHAVCYDSDDSNEFFPTGLTMTPPRPEDNLRKSPIPGMKSFGVVAVDSPRDSQNLIDCP